MEIKVTMNQNDSEFQEIAREELIRILQNEEVVITNAEINHDGKITNIKLEAHYEKNKRSVSEESETEQEG